MFETKTEETSELCYNKLLWLLVHIAVDLSLLHCVFLEFLQQKLYGTTQSKIITYLP